MINFINAAKTFLKDEDGLSAVEYVIAGGVLLVAIAAIFGGLRDATQTEMDSITDAMS